MQYEERYVALIDILGFSSRILADQSGSGAAELAQIYKEIREALKPYRGAKRADWTSLTLFSDTVVVSTLARDDDTDIDTISDFLWCVRRISLILLSHGFLSRGCVLKDRIVHSGDFVVGPAIITAHEYESKVARYPRILVIRDLRKKMERNTHLEQFLSEFLRRSAPSACSSRRREVLPRSAADRRGQSQATPLVQLRGGGPQIAR